MVDNRIQTAIQNWLPRFIAQGVDYHDFVRTMARLNSWDDWCLEWCSTGDAHFARAQDAESKQREVTAGEAYISAALCYHFARFLFQDHPDEYGAASRHAVEAFARGARLLDPTFARVEILFDGATLVGHFRRPAVSLPAPTILLLPGLDSTKEEFFYWEEVLLARGLATFSLDGPGQGECNTTMRADYEVAISSALDVLTKRDDVDRERIGAAGVSLGGYYAVRTLASESRVKAAVENCGPWDWSECWDGLNALTRAAFQYHSGAPDEQKARKFAGKFTLDGVAQKIDRPLLILHGKLDRIVPWEQGQKIADAVGVKAEFVLYEDGNHACNNRPNLYRPLIADWLKEKLA